MIGVFDSGLGGLSVLAAIARALPHAELLYFADSAHVPYGPRSDHFIRRRVLAIGRHLIEQGCQTIVVACNTATAAAVQALRAAHPEVSVVGVEPGIKPAAANSHNRHIAVLATESTARSQRLSQLIAQHAAHVKVEIVACPGWATRIETLHPLDAHSDPAFAQEVSEKLHPLLRLGVDQIVLGCTHYSFLSPLLETLLRQHASPAQLVDVADAVARQVRRLAPPKEHHSAELHLLASARPERLQAALPLLGLHWLTQRIRRPAKQVML